MKKRMERKIEEIPHAVRNREGKLVTEHDEIREVYQEYFENLLKTTNKKTELKEYKETLKKVEEKFQTIRKRAMEQEPKKTERNIVEAVVKSLKRKKERDSEG